MLIMDKETNRLEDLSMVDRYDVWQKRHKGRVEEFERELQASTSKEDLVISRAFKFIQFYSNDVEGLKSYIVFEYDVNPHDAAIIIGGYMKISSDLAQEKLNEVDDYVHDLKLNESVDRRAFTIQRLLTTYNDNYRLDSSLKERDTRRVA
jgi:hypothetical protein